MRKVVVLMAVSILILGCGPTSPQKERTNVPDKQTMKADDLSKGVKNNYAVVWTWVTSDPELVAHHLPAISTELSQLWKNDVIENAYFDPEATSDKLGDFANVTFFLKAQSIPKAHAILNELIVVKQGIATYTLRPVSQLWLGRNTDAINKRGLTSSYVAVWETQNAQWPDASLESQIKEMEELWEAGIIENVYFDFEGSHTTNLVFFVNADSMEDARVVCNALPFHREKIAAYKMYQVGVFWMGKYQAK